MLKQIFSSFIFIATMSTLLVPTSTHAIAGWSAKYKVNCQTCHSPMFARLNYYGERLLWNGYQDPDNDTADGGKVGKVQLGDNLALDKNVRNWLQARINISPVQVITNGQVVDGKDTVPKINIGNTNWLQLFVAGSIGKNISIYIENEFLEHEFEFTWYYMGFTNLLGSKLLNFQLGHLSPVLFSPFPDRLPQLPALGAPGIMRIKSSNGKGDASLDLRSTRPGVQYYGYTGPVMVFGGVSPGAKANHPGGISDLEYWVGGRLLIPESKAGGILSLLEGSSIGYEYMWGTDIKGPKTKTENNYQRHMPGFNIRLGDKLDIQGSYVIGIEDNWNLDTLTASKKKIVFQGDRIVGSYILGTHWAVSGQWDNYWADNQNLLGEERRVYLPVITYFAQENIRISLYPGFDLRDVDDNQKHHEILTNIRVGF